MKNKFRNPYEEIKPKKVGRLSQLNKANRKARTAGFAGLRPLESDWEAEKRFGVIAPTY